MALTLLTLPTEIRLSILLSALTGASGYVKLQYAVHETNILYEYPETFKLIDALEGDPKTISLAIIRTCKQIYTESRGMLWKNIFVIHANQFISLALEGSIAYDFTPSPLFNYIRYAQLDFDFLAERDIWNAHACLQVFADWAATGDLRSVALNGVSASSPKAGLQLAMETFIQEVGTNQNVSNRGFKAASLRTDRKIVLNAGMRKEMMKHQDEFINLDQALSIMHKAVGGEL